MQYVRTSTSTIPNGRIAALRHRFKELLYDAHRAYHSDAYLHTLINVGTTLLALSVIVLLVVLFYYHLNTPLIEDAIRRAGALQGTSYTDDLAKTVLAIRESRLLSGIFIMVIVDIAAAYLIVRVVLRPVRTAFRAQRQFIRNIAHELRTPLSIIKMNNELVLLDPTEQAHTDAATSNVEELDRISQIIDNLLTISALEKPEGPAFCEVDMRALISYLMEKFSAFAHSRGVTLEMADGDAVRAWGNRTAIEQIVSNVLKNAIIYTPRGGHVHISLSRANDYVDLELTDTGIGISPDDLSRVFEPFFRADRSRTRSKGGAGLGLTIVSELVKLHHGSIDVRSTPNKGTSVHIRIPCVENSRARAAATK